MADGLKMIKIPGMEEGPYIPNERTWYWEHTRTEVCPCCGAEEEIGYGRRLPGRRPFDRIPVPQLRVREDGD